MFKWIKFSKKPIPTIKTGFVTSKQLGLSVLLGREGIDWFSYDETDPDWWTQRFLTGCNVYNPN